LTARRKNRGFVSGVMIGKTRKKNRSEKGGTLKVEGLKNCTSNAKSPRTRKRNPPYASGKRLRVKKKKKKEEGSRERRGIGTTAPEVWGRP